MPCGALHAARTDEFQNACASSQRVHVAMGIFGGLRIAATVEVGSPPLLRLSVCTDTSDEGRPRRSAHCNSD